MLGGGGIVGYSLVCLFPQCCHVLLSVVAAETTTTCVAELRALETQHSAHLVLVKISPTAQAGVGSK